MSTTIWLNPKRPPKFEDFLFNYGLGFTVIVVVIAHCICWLARIFTTAFNEGEVLVFSGAIGFFYGLVLSHYNFKYYSRRWHRYFKIMPRHTDDRD